MALQKAPLVLSFTGGIDTDSDQKSVPTTKLINLENAVFTRNTTIQKRNGYRALGRSIDVQNKQWVTATGLGARDNELIVFADGHAYSRRASTDSWSDTGAVASVTAALAQVARTGTQQANADAATNGGVTVVAYEDVTLGGVWCVVLEASTQRELLPATKLHATGERPRCVAVGTVLHVYFAVAAAGRLYSTIVNPVTPSSTPIPVILTEDLAVANPVYDAEPTDSNTGFADPPALIAWCIATGFRVGYVAVTGALGSALTGLPSVATVTATVDGPIAVTRERVNNNVLVVWGAAAVPKYRITDYRDFTTTIVTGSLATAAFAGPVTMRRIVATGAAVSAAGNPMFWFAAELPGATGDVNFVVNGSVDITGATAAGGLLRGHGLASRAWYDSSNGSAFACVAYGAFFFPYVAAISISGTALASTAPIARLLPGLSTGLSTKTHVPSVGASGRQYTIPLGFRIQLSSSNGDQFGESGIQLATLDFGSTKSWQSEQLGRNLYLAGACPLAYDSARWAEADFHCAPDTSTGTIVTVAAAGGAMTPSGKYFYLYCYEEIDAAGELHQGPVSGGTLVTMGVAATQVTHTIPTLRLTSRRQARIAVYRSDFNAIGTFDTIDFHRVTSTDPTTAGAANGYIKNDPTVDTVTFVDQLADTSLDAREPLYTNGGVLSNDPSASAGTAIAGGKSRLFWPDPSDGSLLRYSQQLRDDTALEAPAVLSLRADPYGGNIVGIGVMDGGNFAFKDNAIYVADGPGPDADGGKASTNAFTPFALLTSDVGCKSPGSICQLPIGITFQSSKGIMLLGRDRQVVDIGRDVNGFNSQTIVRATLLPDRQQVVFLTNSGSTLLFDYKRSQWSRFTNHEGLDAVVVGGSYYYLRTDGRVFVETPGVFVDDNSHIRMKVETAFIKMAGYLQGFQKVLSASVIGTYKSSHKLRMRFRIDYDDAYSAPIDVNVDANYLPSLYGDGNYGDGNFGGDITATTRYQIEFHLNRRCQSLSMEFSDVEATSSFGAAFELSELLLIGGVLSGRFPVGAARRQ